MNIGISTFAAKNVEDPERLIALVRKYWQWRKPGAGRHDLTQVVLVPLSPTLLPNLTGRTVTARPGMVFETQLVQRADGEDFFLQTRAIGYEPRGFRKLFYRLGLAKLKPVKPDPVHFVTVVLYSAETLLENNGTRSGDFDWEVVAVVASAVQDEPMEPVTMARNWLEKTGGTFAPYELRPTMESVYFWSNRVKV